MASIFGPHIVVIPGQTDSISAVMPPLDRRIYLAGKWFSTLTLNHNYNGYPLFLCVDDKPPWPKEDDEVLGHIPGVILQRTMTNDYVPTIRSISQFYDNLYFDKTTGRVVGVSPMLLRFCATVWLIGQRELKHKPAPRLDASVFVGDSRLFSTPSPRPLSEVSKTAINRASFYPCKSKFHTSFNKTKQHRSAAFVFGSDMCVKCYKQLTDRRSYRWAFTKSVRLQWDTRFWLATVGKWERLPMLFTLRGMAIHALANPKAARRVSEYTTAGRVASFDPVKAIYVSRRDRRALPTSLASMFDPVTWKIFDILRRRNSGSIEFSKCIPAPDKRDQLAYFGAAMSLKRRLSSEPLFVESTAAPGVFFRHTLDTGICDVLWRSTQLCLEALFEKSSCPDIEIHLVGPGCEPAVPTQPVFTFVDPAATSSDIRDAHLIDWGYLLYLIRYFRADDPLDL